MGAAPYAVAQHRFERAPQYLGATAAIAAFFYPIDLVAFYGGGRMLRSATGWEGELSAWIVTLGAHTPPGAGGPDMSRAYAGGRELPDFGNPGAETVSRNITPDPEHGIGRWSDDDIKRTISTCVRPDRTTFSHTMACDWYAKIAPDDLDAIVAYLRSLKPLKTE
jgi:hypothetical protein